jgi:hypothetical protein
LRIISSMVAVAALAIAAEPAHASPFGPGEQTVIKVEYSGLRAGTATLTVGNATEQAGHKVWPIVMLADTASLFAIYPLHDKFVSWWSFELHRSLGWDFTADENHHDRRERVRLGIPAAGEAQVQTVSDVQPAATAVVPDVRDDAQDIGAAIFQVRRLPLTSGATYTVPVFTGHQVFQMAVHVNPPEAIEVAAGKFAAVPVDMTVQFGGRLQSERPVRVWFSDDAHHAILKFEAKFTLGTVSGETLQYQPGNPVDVKAP